MGSAARGTVEDTVLETAEIVFPVFRTNWDNQASENIQVQWKLNLAENREGVVRAAKTTFAM